MESIEAYSDLIENRDPTFINHVDIWNPYTWPDKDPEPYQLLNSYCFHLYMENLH